LNDKRRSPVRKKTDQSLTKLADAAIQQAARKVVEHVKESGTPVIVWDNEEVKKVEPRKTRTARTKRNGHAVGE